MQIPFHFYSKGHYRHLHQLFEQWEARSRPRGLVLAVCSCYPTANNPIVDLLLSNASRICELTLSLSADHFHQFLQAPAGSFPILEKLTMIVIPKAETVYDASSGLSWYESPSDYPNEDDPDGGDLWESMAGSITSLEDLP
ncbi:hypothetical protein B0H14DRAFT_3426414 [Mycena olivaceomarginata]|nr:hypothetical protein B0H14DRAFT_3426414 [Mycena olivaceomarginata]